MSTITSPSIQTKNKPVEHISDLHNRLLKIANSDAQYLNPIGDVEPLLSFNGYYSLNSKGSFLTIDTNLLVKNGTVTPHVSLIYSADGINSNVYDLTGPDRAFHTVKWSGTTLNAQASQSSGTPSFSLKFSREDSAQEITSTFKGKLTKGFSEEIVAINGSTYNNPIPMAMYAGTYCEEKGKGDEILKIGSDNSIQYNYVNVGGHKGGLKNVDVFIYNLNMYVFSFSKLFGELSYSIIMGTSSDGGKVCNDLFSLKNTQLAIPRPLQTITETHVKKTVNRVNSKSEELAKFAGFYNLSSTSLMFKNAFISIEGKYKTVVGKPSVYTITIGVSLNGTSITVYTFDESMEFKQNGNSATLIIPITDPIGSNLTINFTRQYKGTFPNSGSFYGSVVSISGSYNVAQFNGESLLNVVPLIAYSGAPLKVASSNETIVINSNTEVEYKGIVYNEITVVPLMYIVGFIDNKGDEVIFSLGTDGGKGVTSITTVRALKTVNGKKVVSKILGIKVYTAIPEGNSAAPQH